MILDFLLNVPWLEISWGFFISGILLTIISVVGATEGGADHDLGHDTDIGHDFGVGHGMDIEHEIGMGHDFDVGHDTDIEHEISSGHGGSTLHEGHFGESSSTPLTLMLGGFLLVYGGFGIAVFNNYGITLTNIGLLLAIAIFAVMALSFTWKKVFATGTYIWKPQYAVGKIATVAMDVDAKGGSIKVETHTPLGIITYPAKSMEKDRKYEEGDLVLVVGFKDGYAIVYDVPKKRK